MKNQLRTILTLALIGCAGAAYPQSTMWGGQGAIALSQAQIPRGAAETVFYFPNDFRGNDQVAAGTNMPGVYYVQCYWYIEGYGVNGAVAAANAMFVVQ